MSGTFAYARAFHRGEPYAGRDGRPHYELIADGGDQVSMSNITWAEMKRQAAILGIPDEAWPHYPSSIDIDLTRKNERLRKLFAEIDESAVADKSKLRQLWHWSREGKQFYFAET
jgi:hypothetical protein